MHAGRFVKVHMRMPWDGWRGLAGRCDPEEPLAPVVVQSDATQSYPNPESMRALAGSGPGEVGRLGANTGEADDCRLPFLSEPPQLPSFPGGRARRLSHVWGWGSDEEGGGVMRGFGLQRVNARGREGVKPSEGGGRILAPSFRKDIFFVWRTVSAFVPLWEQSGDDRSARDEGGRGDLPQAENRSRAG